MDDVSIKKIKTILNVAEQGSSTIPYDKVEVMPDGKGGRPQITLSVGFTQDGGNLGNVIEEYVKRGGKYGELGGYKMSDASLSHNVAFRRLLKAAGGDPIMQEVQDELYVTLYIGPGIKWAETEGFVEPLSYLVICDSFLHSGSILTVLRNRFSEKTPKREGDEKKWILAYVEARQKWLINHSNKLLRNTIYRTRYYQELAKREDWQLMGYHKIAMNGIRPNLIA
jgi:chitosanase